MNTEYIEKQNTKIFKGNLAEDRVKNIYLDKYNILLKKTSKKDNLCGADFIDDVSIPNKFIDIKNNNNSYIFQYNRKKQYASVVQPYRLMCLATHIIINSEAEPKIIKEYSLEEYFNWWLPNVDIQELKIFLNSFQGYLTKEEYNRKAFKITNYLKGIIDNNVFVTEFNKDENMDCKIILKRNK